MTALVSIEDANTELVVNEPIFYLYEGVRVV